MIASALHPCRTEHPEPRGYRCHTTSILRRTAPTPGRSVHLRCAYERTRDIFLATPEAICSSVRRDDLNLTHFTLTYPYTKMDRLSSIVRIWSATETVTYPPFGAFRVSSLRLVLGSSPLRTNVRVIGRRTDFSEVNVNVEKYFSPGYKVFSHDSRCS